MIQDENAFTTTRTDINMIRYNNNFRHSFLIKRPTASCQTGHYGLLPKLVSSLLLLQNCGDVIKMVNLSLGKFFAAADVKVKSEVDTINNTR